MSFSSRPGSVFDGIVTSLDIPFVHFFVFIIVADVTSSGECMLKSLYGMVRESIEKLPGWPDVPTLLLVDDLSILTSTGYPSFDVAIFAHYLQSLVCSGQANKSGCMVCLVHVDAGLVDAFAPLHSIVGHRSDMIVSVQPLKTGYCRDLNGEVGQF
jgi:hypothetical protein